MPNKSQQPLSHLADIISDDTIDNPVLSSISPISALLIEERRRYESATELKQSCESKITRVATGKKSPEGRTIYQIVDPGDAAFYASIEAQSHQAAIEGLACGVLVITDNLMKIYLRAALSEWKIERTHSNYRTWVSKIWKCGAKVNDAFWADAVDAASNYVRHSDEWRDATGIGEQLSGRAAQNMLTLTQLGFEEDELKWGRVHNDDLIDKLQLTDWTKTHINLSEWAAFVLTLSPR